MKSNYYRLYWMRCTFSDLSLINALHYAISREYTCYIEILFTIFFLSVYKSYTSFCAKLYSLTRSLLWIESNFENVVLWFTFNWRGSKLSNTDLEVRILFTLFLFAEIEKNLNSCFIRLDSNLLLSRYPSSQIVPDQERRSISSHTGVVGVICEKFKFRSAATLSEVSHMYSCVCNFQCPP